MDSTVITIILLVFLIVCSVTVSLTRGLWQTVIVFMSYSFVMAIIWVLLQAPDLALTEAAIGAGVTCLLFFVALRRINIIKRNKEESDREDIGNGN